MEKKFVESLVLQVACVTSMDLSDLCIPFLALYPGHVGGEKYSGLGTRLIPFHKWWHAVHEAYLCIGNQQVYPVCTREQ